MALRELLLPWDGQPQEAVEIDHRWRQRGLKSAYLLQPGIWNRNIVTGAIGGSVLGSGFGFSNGKLTTYGISGNGALLDHGLALNIALPISIVVGWKLISGGVAWSLLRTDAATWSGWYGGASGSVTATNNNSFDGVIALGNTDCVAFSHKGSNNLVAYGGGRGRATDTALTTPTGVATSQVCLGNSRRSATDNASVSEFTHFYAFQSALTDSELEELASEPWQLFQPRRTYVPAAAAATAPTLSAATYASLTSTTVRPRVTVTF